MATPHARNSLKIAKWQGQRQSRLEKLGYASYGEYLASGHWRSVRARYRASGLPKNCQMCDEEKVVLHHQTYERLGEEELTDLVPLCPSCHELVHTLAKRGYMGLNVDGLADPERAKRYAIVQEQRDAQALSEFLRLGELVEREGLRLDLRLRNVLILGKAYGVDMSRSLRLIAHTIGKIEDQVDRSDHGTQLQTANSTRKSKIE